MAAVASGFGCGEGLLELIQFLVHLGPHAIDVVPFETGGRSFLGDRHGSGQGPLAPQLAAQFVGEGKVLPPGRLFLAFDLLPAALFTAKDMGMAPHQLGADRCRHAGQVKGLTFLGQLGMEHHLEQQIAEFIG